MPNKKVTKTKSKKSTKVSSAVVRSLAAKTTTAKTSTTKATGGLSAKLFDMQGKSLGTVTLPKETFGQVPNRSLLAQAIRVYFANSTPRKAHTKTRGEVHGGGIKPWRQKGTGRARAGSIRSPLWVGGGTTFGPRFNNAKLILPQKMKKKALFLALSQKAKSGAVKIIQNIEKIEPKTKKVANLLKKLETKNNVLLVISEKNQNVKLATRNIQNLEVETPAQLNAYTVIKNYDLLISKESLAKFK